MKVSKHSIEDLLAENVILREEILVSRQAADITARLVVDQFVKIDDMVRNLEENMTAEKKLRQYLAAMHETTLGLIGRLNLDDLLDNVVARAGQILGTPNGFAYILDSELDMLEPMVGRGVFSGANILPWLKKGEGVSGSVWESGLPLVINDYDSWEGRSPHVRTKLMSSIVCVPLKSDSEVVGIIGMAHASESTRSFGDSELEVLSRFAQLASVALENVRLFTAAGEARQAAEAASRAKDTFLANMSHELRTPLNAIIGYSEMLIEDAADLDPAEAIPDLQRIHSAGKHLMELIGGILDLSKIEAGRMDLYLETFEVSELIDDVVNTIRPMMEKQSNVLSVRCGENLGTMHADLTKVRQCLFNLLGNASKFTNDGTITLEVSRETVEKTDWVNLAVSDTGIGMTPQQLEKLFQPFTQADASTTRKFGGTGLGLTITRRFCRMMQGDVTVASEYGKETTFTIRLPAKVSKTAIPETTPETPSPQITANGGGVVLVIDDDASVRSLLSRFLGKEGFRVKTANGGEEGLRLARDLRPDAITLDVMMPGMDGWAVLTALKADPELALIPVIMLTIVDDKTLGYTLGASEYLTKPVDRERLCSVLQKYCTSDGSSLGRVLVVEDDGPTRELLRRLLERDGWVVGEAENGRVALESILETLPSVILLDLMMPEMDGFEFLHELRKNDSWHAIPVIVITAKDLTANDRIRLNGSVMTILRKGTYTRSEILSELRDLVGTSIRMKDEGQPSSGQH